MATHVVRMGEKLRNNDRISSFTNNSFFVIAIQEIRELWTELALIG
jgi:hypothetical protein